MSGLRREAVVMRKEEEYVGKRLMGMDEEASKARAVTDVSIMDDIGIGPGCMEVLRPPTVGKEEEARRQEWGKTNVQRDGPEGSRGRREVRMTSGKKDGAGWRHFVQHGDPTYNGRRRRRRRRRRSKNTGARKDSRAA